MKVEYKVYCHEHTEEVPITEGTTSYEDDALVFDIGKPCSQCLSEAYERGIESVLAKRYGRNVEES